MALEERRIELRQRQVALLQQESRIMRGMTGEVDRNMEPITSAFLGSPDPDNFSRGD